MRRRSWSIITSCDEEYALGSAEESEPAGPMKYFANLTTGRTVLWCYLLWYLFFAIRYFDPSVKLWLTSIGLAGIIGIALVISTSGGNSRLDRWQILRLFLMPFCVSSFAALVKGRNFILIFSPRWGENVAALGWCALFLGFVAAVKTLGSR